MMRILALSVLLIFTACKKIKPTSVLATLTVRSIQSLDYDSSAIQVKSNDSIVFENKNVPRSQEKIDLSLKPGNYSFHLDYRKGTELVASSSFCGTAQNFNLLAGPNFIQVDICKKDGSSVFQPSCDVDKESLGRRSLRRLTRLEIQKSVEAILGSSFDVMNQLPADSKDEGLDNSVETLVVTSEHAKAYLDMAKSISEKMLERSQTFLECQDGSCMDQFLNNYGSLIWRKKLSTEEKSSLLAYYQQEVQNQGSWQDGFSSMVAAMFFAPEFIYRAEIGSEMGGVAKLNDYEIASGLSFLLWGRGPDRELIDLASQGKLQDKKILKEQAERLLATDLAKGQLGHFVDVWLETEKILAANKDQNKWPDFNEGLKRDLYNETRDFYNHLTFESGADFESLFLSNYTIASSRVANFYGGSMAQNKVFYPEGERRGILGHGSILASHSNFDGTNPIQRGVFFLEKILCDELPPPPDSLDIQPPPRDPNATSRERFAAHTDNPACAACHVKIDGSGFGFENMDSAGKIQLIDNGSEVDSKGTVVLDGLRKEFDGVYELSGLVAKSEQARLCFAKSVYKQSYGVHGVKQGQCAIESLQSKFLSHENIKMIWLDLILDKAFSERRL